MLKGQHHFYWTVFFFLFLLLSSSSFFMIKIKTSWPHQVKTTPTMTYVFLGRYQENCFWQVVKSLVLSLQRMKQKATRRREKHSRFSLALVRKRPAISGLPSFSAASGLSQTSHYLIPRKPPVELGRGLGHFRCYPTHLITGGPKEETTPPVQLNFKVH